MQPIEEDEPQSTTEAQEPEPTTINEKVINDLHTKLDRYSVTLQLLTTRIGKLKNSTSGLTTELVRTQAKQVADQLNQILDNELNMLENICIYLGFDKQEIEVIATEATNFLALQKSQVGRDQLMGLSGQKTFETLRNDIQDLDKIENDMKLKFMNFMFMQVGNHDRSSGEEGEAEGAGKYVQIKPMLPPSLTEEDGKFYLLR